VHKLPLDSLKAIKDKECLLPNLLPFSSVGKMKRCWIWKDGFILWL